MINAETDERKNRTNMAKSSFPWVKPNQTFDWGQKLITLNRFYASEWGQWEIKTKSASTSDWTLLQHVRLQILK